MNQFPEWKRELHKVPHKLMSEPLEVLVRFYKEHLQRDIQAGRLTPSAAFEMLRGFLMAAMQTYSAVCILLADKRPKRLMLQASVLNRALFETFATVVPLPRNQRVARKFLPASTSRACRSAINL
jgi:hypothetical protein